MFLVMFVCLSVCHLLYSWYSLRLSQFFLFDFNAPSFEQVLRGHQDFRDGNNPPRDVNFTDPEFRIVRQQEKRTVLVLDKSASMDDQNRIEILAQVTNFIVFYC